MIEVKAEIIALLNDAFPGFVRVRLVDRHNREWLIDEKLPVLGADLAVENGSLPQDIWLEAVELSTHTGRPGDEPYLLVSLAHGVEAVDGQRTFELHGGSTRATTKWAG